MKTEQRIFPLLSLKQVCSLGIILGNISAIKDDSIFEEKQTPDVIKAVITELNELLHDFGTRIEYKITRPCMSCEGAGELFTEYATSPVQITPHQKELECTECNGTGVLIVE